MSKTLIRLCLAAIVIAVVAIASVLAPSPAPDRNAISLESIQTDKTTVFPQVAEKTAPAHGGWFVEMINGNDSKEQMKVAADSVK